MGRPPSPPLDDATTAAIEEARAAAGSHRELLIWHANNYGALAAATFRQSHFWQDSMSLWTRAVAVQPLSQNANNNLAILLRKQGRIDQAIACYRRAIESHPDEANAYYNLGNALKELARDADESGDPAATRDYYEQAVAQYRRAIDCEPLQAS